MATDNVREINEHTFQTEVLRSGSPVLVVFFATWCGPCRALTPVIEELAKEYEETLTVVRLNVVENESVAKAFQVRGLPSVLLFDQGRVAARVANPTSRKLVEDLLVHAIPRT